MGRRRSPNVGRIVGQGRLGPPRRVEAPTFHGRDHHRLPAFTLQPIVENAINHGLRDVKWEKRITLRVCENAEHIRVTVTDNGNGMTQEEIDAVLVGQPVAIEMDGQQHRGTGLKNVIERLRIYYNTHDVFEIQSTIYITCKFIHDFKGIIF